MYQINRKRYIPFLEVPVVEHCNLNCELCNSHASYIDSSTYDFEQFKRDVDIIERSVHYGMITFLGGEPLLNTRLWEYISYAKSRNLGEIYRVLTNGILLREADVKVYEEADVIEVSHYPECKESVQEMKKFLKQQSRVYKFTYYIKDIKYFNQVDTTNLSKEEAQKGYESCDQIRMGNLIFNGYYFKCMRPKTTQIYLKKSCGIELEGNMAEEDGLKIEPEHFGADLEAYLSKKTMMKACQYCLMGKEESIRCVILAKHFGFMHPITLKLYYHHFFIYHTYKKIKKMIQVDEAISSKKGSMVLKKHRVLKNR